LTLELLMRVLPGRKGGFKRVTAKAKGDSKEHISGKTNEGLMMIASWRQGEELAKDLLQDYSTTGTNNGIIRSTTLAS
jgi:hypothetical protein